MRVSLYLFLMYVAASCTGTTVMYDYDRSLFYKDYTSYQYDLSEATGLSSFDEKRFIKYTDSVLQSRGFTRTSFNDFFIKIEASEYETASRNLVGIGVGGGGRSGGIGVSGGIPIGGKEVHQQIITTLYDAQENQKTFWEATSESDLKLNAKPTKRDEHYRKLVEKIFSKYPPQK